MLRARAAEEDGKSDHMDRMAADLAWIVAGKIEDQFVARDLVSDVMVTFTDLRLAGFSPNEPIAPKRQAVLAAIDRLDKATR
jgi:hypothetical protein